MNSTISFGRIKSLYWDTLRETTKTWTMHTLRSNIYTGMDFFRWRNVNNLADNNILRCKALVTLMLTLLYGYFVVVVVVVVVFVKEVEKEEVYHVFIANVFIFVALTSHTLGQFFFIYIEYVFAAAAADHLDCFVSLLVASQREFYFYLYLTLKKRLFTINYYYFLCVVSFHFSPNISSFFFVVVVLFSPIHSRCRLNWHYVTNFNWAHKYICKYTSTIIATSNSHHPVLIIICVCVYYFTPFH